MFNYPSEEISPYFTIVDYSKENDLPQIANLCKEYLNNQRNLVVSFPNSNNDISMQYIKIINDLTEYGLYNLTAIEINLKTFLSESKEAMGIYNPYFVRHYLPYYLKSSDQSRNAKIFCKLQIKNLVYSQKGEETKFPDAVLMNYCGEDYGLLLRTCNWKEGKNYPSFNIETVEGLRAIYFLPIEVAKQQGKKFRVPKQETFYCIFQSQKLLYSFKFQKYLNKNSLSNKVMYFIPTRVGVSAGAISTCQPACQLKEYLQKTGYENYQYGYMTRMFNFDEAELIHPDNFKSESDIVTFLSSNVFCFHESPKHFQKKNLNDLDNDFKTAQVIRMLVVNEERYNDLIKQGIIQPVEHGSNN